MVVAIPYPGDSDVVEREVVAPIEKPLPERGVDRMRSTRSTARDLTVEFDYSTDPRLEDSGDRDKISEIRNDLRARWRADLTQSIRRIADLSTPSRRRGASVTS